LLTESGVAAANFSAGGSKILVTAVA